MSIIPVNLDEQEAGPLPDSVYELSVNSVKNLNSDGTECAVDEVPVTVQLNVGVIGDDPELLNCRTNFQNRLNIPQAEDDASTRDFKKFLIKKACEGFGVEHGEAGFDPNDFVGKLAKCLVVQTTGKNGMVYNNIKQYMA